MSVQVREHELGILDKWNLLKYMQRAYEALATHPTFTPPRLKLFCHSGRDSMGAFGLLIKNIHAVSDL